jgi:alkyl hydroperoxide reductase subunit AhpC
MLPAKEAVGSAERSAADNAAVRTVFVIDPDKLIRLHFAYPMSTGRNFAELIRSIGSMQLTGA